MTQPNQQFRAFCQRCQIDHMEPRKLTYVYARDRKILPLLKREVLPYPKPDRDDLGIPVRVQEVAS